MKAFAAASAFIIGGIITLTGTAHAADRKGAEDYSVNNVPGSPGDSPGKTRMEEDVKTHREAVRDANDAHEQAIATYGRHSQEAKKAGRNLDAKHSQLERNLYQQGQVPGAPSSTQKMSGNQDGKSFPSALSRQVEF